MNNFFILNEKNIKLNIITHQLDNPAAILIHLHGLHSHFQHIYDCVDDFNNRIKYFQRANILSYALEFRGHGKSSGNKGDIENMDNLVDDIKRLLEYIKCLHSNIPIFILGESMGGAIAVKSSVFIKEIDGVILLAPMFDISKKIKPSKIVLDFGLFLAKIFPGMKLGNKTKIKKYKYLEYQKNYELCEFNIKKNVNLRTLKECHNISNWIKENNKLFYKKLLLIHSVEDDVTCIDESINFYNNCSSEDKNIFILDNSGHSVLVPKNEYDIIPDSLVSKITNWINKRI